MERLREEEIKLVLLRDQGSQAHLVSWSHESLASKLDGATSNFFNVRVKFKGEEKESETCYAVKFSPTRELKANDFYSLIFTKECRFYSEVIPAMSSVLEEVNERPVSFPKCYYNSIEEGKEVLFLENLKEKGYSMQNKALGLDLPHTCLVMRELGKFHAASVLLQAKISVDLAEYFDFYQTEWTEKFNLGCDWGSFMDQFLNSAVLMLQEMGDCDTEMAWLKRVKSEAWTLYRQMIKRKTPFNVIVHGDCWINNMFFRYDEADHPVDVTFIDLQGTRIASVVIDLQHFLNLNVKDKVRRFNFDTIINAYYDSFCRVLNAGNVAVPFTLEQLKEEYISKGFYGVLYSLMFIPCMVSMEEGSYVFEKEEKRRATVQRMVHTNPLLRPTILSVLKEWTERGLIS